MKDYLNLDEFPLDRPDSDAYRHLVDRCRIELERTGMYNLTGFVKPATLDKAVAELAPRMASHSFTHQRKHNVYFKPHVDGLPKDHPALAMFQTVNHTLCGDQLAENPVVEIYEWAPLARFIADTMNKDHLFAMKDPLARVNVMAYREGEALNWHFDRSEFTTTLLLQAPEYGGRFEYRTNLRSADDPNYEGVARLLAGNDPDMISIDSTPGTLNVFRGINTPHRVTAIEGSRERIIAVFSYYDRPGVVFSKDEQVGFYGRSA